MRLEEKILRLISRTRREQMLGQMGDHPRLFLGFETWQALVAEMENRPGGFWINHHPGVVVDRLYFEGCQVHVDPRHIDGASYRMREHMGFEVSKYHRLSERPLVETLLDTEPGQASGMLATFALFAWCGNGRRLSGAIPMFSRALGAYVYDMQVLNSVEAGPTTFWLLKGGVLVAWGKEATVLARLDLPASGGLDIRHGAVLRSWDELEPNEIVAQYRGLRNPDADAKDVHTEWGWE